MAKKRNYASKGDLKKFLEEFKQLYRIKETSEKKKIRTGRVDTGV